MWNSFSLRAGSDRSTTGNVEVKQSCSNKVLAKKTQ